MDSIEDVLHRATPKQRCNFILLLKAHGIPIAIENGCASFDTTLVPDDLVKFFSSHVTSEKDASVNNDETLDQEMQKETAAAGATATAATAAAVAATAATSKKGGKKVTIMDDQEEKTAVSEKKTQWADIEDLEKRMKQNVSLRPSQLRIKKKIKDLLKKISKHKHVCPDKNYGQDIKDDNGGDGVGDDVAVDEAAESVVGENDEPYEFGFDEYGDDHASGDNDTYAGENDDVDNLTEDAFDNIDEDESKLAEDTDGDVDTDDASVRDPDDTTEVDTSVDDEAALEDIEASIEDASLKTPSVHHSETSDARLDFKGMSMTERFTVYKRILETERNMDFGDISHLGLDGTT